MLRADEFKQGASLGKYEIIRKIAVGGMAQIYLARTRGTAGFEKLVVLKRILPSVAEDASFVRMFLDEARLAATLRHPNIADVFDVGAEDNSYYFAMEFIQGQDARTIRIAAYELGRTIPIEISLAIISGTAYALAYAHAKTGPNGPLGIVHRDITPSNILVSYDGAVKLVDFGIARADSRTTDVKTRTGTLKGKVPYMSPEQCKGKQLDRRSDLFSLGTVLYELTTGQRPFEGHSEYDTLEMIVHGRPQPPSVLVPSYLPELEDIVMKLLARDPAARYQDADSVLLDLEKLTSDAGLMVSDRAVARYMREVFAEEIAEGEAAAIQSAPAEFSGDLATGSGEGRLSLELDESTPLPRDLPHFDSTRQYPRSHERPPSHLLPDEPPTLEVKVDADGEPMRGLLVMPEMQVFVRTNRPTTPPPASRPPTRPPGRPPTRPPPTGTDPAAPVVVGPTPSAATRAATLAGPSRASSPAPSLARSASLPTKPPPLRPRDFADEVPTAKATPGDIRQAQARSLPTQPDKTRLDAILRFDPIMARGDDLLDEVDLGAPRDEKPEERSLRRVNELCSRCRAWLASGDFDQAVVAAELALEEPAGNDRVQRALARETQSLSAAFESFLGDPKRPVLLDRPLDELTDLKLDEHAAFLLSRIDGEATVEELLDMSGMPRFDVSRLLCRLVLRKLIVVG